MNKIIKICMLFSLSWPFNCIAQVEIFYCQAVGSEYQYTMTIDYTKKQITNDAHNIQDIKHMNEKYITSYSRFGTGDGVGGRVDVFNRRTLVVTSVDIEHANSPEGTDELISNKYSSQCKK